MGQAQDPVHLELLLFQAFLWMDESLQSTLKQNGFPAMGRSQSMILLAVETGVKRPVRLARLMGVSRQAIKVQLQELAALGVLELVPDPSDGRAKIIRIQKQAQPLIEVARQSLRACEAKLATRIGGAQLAALRAALEANWGDPIAEL